jgi:hypothetical protein
MARAATHTGDCAHVLARFLLRQSGALEVALAIRATYHLASSNREVNSMAKLVLPRVQAMVVCDALKESDEESGVYHLNGVRTAMEVPSFPALRPRLGVFAQMSGHAGHAKLQIVINRIETDENIYQSAPKEFSFSGPTSLVMVVFRFRNCVFPAPGVYYVQMFHEDKLIGERALDVRLEG